jgi:hypothetical protein
MRKIGIALVAFIFAGIVLAAESGPSVIPLSSPVYALMDSLYLVAGRGTPSASRPWSVAEARAILSRVNSEGLRGGAAVAYASILRSLDADKAILRGDASLDLKATASLEAYAQTRADGSALETDWIRGYEERKPLLKASLETSYRDAFFAYGELEFSRARFSPRDAFAADPAPHNVGTASLPAGSLWATRSDAYGAALATNIPRMDDANFETPRRAFMSFGGDWWNLEAGRDLLSWGNGRSGNMIIGDHLDHHDFARFTAFGENIKTEALALFLTHPAFVGAGEYPNPGTKMLLAHRLEARPLAWFSFAVSENVMYQGGPIDPAYLNPSFVYHNLNNHSCFNAIASVEASLSALKGFDLYGQFALDQARAPLEGDTQPAAWGALGGLRYGASLDSGLLEASIEYAMTTPYMYRRDIVDFLVIERNYVIGPGYAIHGDYLGYRYGGDAAVARGGIEYRIPEIASAAFSATFVRHGEVGMSGVPNDVSGTIFPNGASPFLSGSRIAERLILSLKAEYELPVFPPRTRAKAWVEADWIGARSYVKETVGIGAYYEGESQNAQFTAGCSISI